MAKKVIIAVLLLLLVGIYFFRNEIKEYLNRGQRTVNQTEVKLLFKTPPTLSELLSVLLEEGVIADYASVRSVIQEEGLDTMNFAAGKFLVLPQERTSKMILGFTKGENGHGNAELKVKVVFNRCRDIYDIGTEISKCILADSTQLVDYILSGECSERYQMTKEEIPAIFLPKAYELYFDTDARAFVEHMYTAYQEFWTPERKQQLARINLKTPVQASVLASIVYSEQGKIPNEWPIIASLYLNRLKKGMKLQSDPTFKFCWGRELDGVQRLLKKHRDVDCAYNTYRIDGLPPGPIFITPEAVIDAVLNAAETDFLFMCAKPDYSGAHDFTSSDRVHEANATRYRKWLRNELKKTNG